jgi:hypothetical protein
MDDENDIGNKQDERFEKEIIVNPQKELKLRRYFNGNADPVVDKVSESVQALKNDNNVANIFNELPGAVSIPEDVELKVVYKDGKDGNKLEYQIRWGGNPSKRQSL